MDLKSLFDKLILRGALQKAAGQAPPVPQAAPTPSAQQYLAAAIAQNPNNAQQGQPQLPMPPMPKGPQVNPQELSLMSMLGSIFGRR